MSIYEVVVKGQTLEGDLVVLTFFSEAKTANEAESRITTSQRVHVLDSVTEVKVREL